MFDVAVRAEIALGRGDVDNGLSLWRQAAGRLRDNDDLSALSSWALEVQAVAVVAHAWHGRLDLVEEITAELPRALSIMVADQKSAANTPVCGALLLALAMVDIDTGEPGAMRSGARMIALAERFRFGRGFQPTMSVARVRQVAEDADRPAYLDTMSSYAGLDPDALRAAALAHLGSRRYSARAQR
jgi:hypothetical protein